MGNENIESVARELYDLAESIGIETALKFTFGDNVVVSLQIPRSLLEKEIVTFDLPARVGTVVNKWCGMYSDKPKTVDRIVSLLSMGDYAKEFVRGYGDKSKSYLKTLLLMESYERYTEEQKMKFCYNTILLNCEV